MDTIQKNNPGKVGKVAKFRFVSFWNRLLGGSGASLLFVFSLSWRFFNFSWVHVLGSTHENTLKIPWQSWQTFGKIRDGVGKVGQSQGSDFFLFCGFWVFFHLDTFSQNTPWQSWQSGKVPVLYHPGIGCRSVTLFVLCLFWRFFNFLGLHFQGFKSRKYPQNPVANFWQSWQTFGKVRGGVGKVHCNRKVSASPFPNAPFLACFTGFVIFPTLFSGLVGSLFCQCRGRLCQSFGKVRHWQVGVKKRLNYAVFNGFLFQPLSSQRQLCHFANFATVLFQNTGSAPLFIYFQYITKGPWSAFHNSLFSRFARWPTLPNLAFQFRNYSRNKLQLLSTIVNHPFNFFQFRNTLNL
jgi:hypothetical protein